MRVALEDIELSDFENQVSALFGGVALEESDTIYIKPNCCGDIGNILEWEDVFKKEGSDWSTLWIGHPWVLYKNTGNMITFSDYTESSPDDVNTYEILISVSAQELQSELKKLRVQQNELNRKSEKFLKKRRS